MIYVNKDKVCNLASYGKGISGISPSQETRDKIGKGRKGKRHKLEYRKILKERFNNLRILEVEKKKKKIIRSDGKIFVSLTEAGKLTSLELNRTISLTSISSCCLGKSVTAYGFAWSYDISTIPKLVIPKMKRKKVLCVETKEIFRSGADAARWIKTFREKAYPSYISVAIKNKWMAYGYHWEMV